MKWKIFFFFFFSLFSIYSLKIIIIIIIKNSLDIAVNSNQQFPKLAYYITSYQSRPQGINVWPKFWMKISREWKELFQKFKNWLSSFWKLFHLKDYNFLCRNPFKNQNKPSYWLTIEQLKIKTSHLIGSNRPMCK